MNNETLIDLKKDLLKQEETPQQQIKSREKHFQDIEIEKKKIIEEINLPEELNYLFKISAFFMYIKDLRKGIYQKSYVEMDRVLEEISKRCNLTLKETKFLNYEEINQALNEDKNFREITRQRKEYCITITKEGKTKIYQGEDASKKIEGLVQREKIDKNITELKGSTAYSGKAKGIVKIILTVEDMPKMKEGDILVSSATNPDLVPAMRLASAFVTDTGGITCHAAIVSREMKKPCVVGTKIATRVFQDGDQVEVNAKEGIIKRIK